MGQPVMAASRPPGRLSCRDAAEKSRHESRLAGKTARPTCLGCFHPHADLKYWARLLLSLGSVISSGVTKALCLDTLTEKFR